MNPGKTPIALRSALLLAGLAALASAGEVREWTGARNLKIKGEFVAIKTNQVVVKNEEGQFVEIPMMQLSTSDQMYARKLAMQQQAQPGRANKPTGVQTNVLPYFTEGKWAGWHAVYDHPKMEVLIETNGCVYVWPKNEGKRVGAAIPCRWGIGYYPAASVQPVGRPVLYFDEPPPPTVFKNKHTLKGVAQDKVKLELEVECENNHVEFKVEMREPTGIIAGYLAVGVTIYATHSFPDGTPLEKIARELTGYSLVFKEPKGPEIKYDYHPHLSLTNHFVSTTIKGPWAPRVVTIEQKRGALYLSNYTLTPLYRGYSISKYLGTGPSGPGIRFTIE